MDKHSFGFGGTGKKSHDKQFDTYGEPFGLHDVIGCLLDLDAATVSFRCVLALLAVTSPEALIPSLRHACIFCV